MAQIAFPPWATPFRKRPSPETNYGPPRTLFFFENDLHWNRIRALTPFYFLKTTFTGIGLGASTPFYFFLKKDLRRDQIRAFASFFESGEGRFQKIKGREGPEVETLFEPKFYDAKRI